MQQPRLLSAVFLRLGGVNFYFLHQSWMFHYDFILPCKVPTYTKVWLATTAIYRIVQMRESRTHKLVATVIDLEEYARNLTPRTRLKYCALGTNGSFNSLVYAAFLK